MELSEVLAERHSYRGRFRDEAVSREDLRTIVQAGLMAPSGCNAQTTSFVIVDEREPLAQIARIMDRPVVHFARAVIVCVAHHRPVYQGMSFGAEDCAAAVENMLLAITDLGYASVWIDGALRTDGRAQAIAAALGIPETREVRVILPIGRPAEPRKQPTKKPFDDRACFNAWTIPE